MTPIQDIVFKLTGDIYITLHVIKAHDRSPYTCETLVFDPQGDPQYSTLHKIEGTFTTAQDAYRKLVEWVINFKSQRTQTVTSINNPCNCEFISKEDQQAIIDELKVVGRVLVNGS